MKKRMIRKLWAMTGILLFIAVSPCPAEERDLAPVFRIDKTTVSNYSYNNRDLFAGDIKALAVDLQGLSYGDLKVDPNPIDRALAEKSVLVIQPWLGPWNWANYQAIYQIDQIIAATLDKYGVKQGVPIVLYGRSMGGLIAYNYAVYGKYPVAGIAANGPVTDLRFFSIEREDNAKTIYRAYAHYDSGIDKAVDQHSPIKLAAKLPNVPYLIISSAEDDRVSKAAHADKFVDTLKLRGFNIQYLDVPGMAHVEFDSPGKFDAYPQVLERYIGFIAGFAR
jgi:pimeloyl-ACP methyl ester carboxylesterase